MPQDLSEIQAEVSNRPLEARWSCCWKYWETWETQLQPTPPGELECFKARAFHWQATLRWRTRWRIKLQPESQEVNIFRTDPFGKLFKSLRLGYSLQTTSRRQLIVKICLVLMYLYHIYHIRIWTFWIFWGLLEMFRSFPEASLRILSCVFWKTDISIRTQKTSTHGTFERF